MVEFQACNAGLDAPCAPHAKGSFRNEGGNHVATRDENGEEEGKGINFLDGVKGGAGVSTRPLLKRVRPEEDESAVSTVDITSGNEIGTAFLHRHHHVHRHPAVHTTSNFALAASPQQLMPEVNGHLVSSGHSDSSFAGDHHVILESNHHVGLLCTQMPVPGSYLGVNIAEVLAELERERRKNAELQSKLSSLEAKLGSEDRQGGAFSPGNKRNKKQRQGERPGDGDDVESRKSRTSLPLQLQAVKQEEDLGMPMGTPEIVHPPERQDTVVNWMSREEVTAADLEKLGKDLSDLSDSDDDEEDDDEYDDDEDDDGKEEDRDKTKRKGEIGNSWKQIGAGEVANKGCPDVKMETQDKIVLFQARKGRVYENDNEVEGKRKRRRRKKRKEGMKCRPGEKAYLGKRGFGHEVVAYRGPGVISSYKKVPKSAFCPKEVKRIMESGVLALKNAQSHTMRKIIVFASLGIRHGCEDLYELDFKHFSVVRRGEPFKSTKDPGEHVLYDHPGVRKKIFYPNRQNAILCPVRILDEEKVMRPAGPGCPSCLFLCIKYGGRTRNLPQNEYVRQRMGRNKLKSFGPLMCQMALLVHIRTGSFFFKALGITLLFMAGFPDDLVRKETKYRNLDLLQKYYRSDEDGKGEQLFHPYPPFFPQAMMVTPAIAHKSIILGTKAIGKKGPPPLLSKPPSSITVPRYLQPISTRPAVTSSFHGPQTPSAFPAPTATPTVPTTSAAPSGKQSPPGPPPPPPFGIYPPYPTPVPRPPGGFGPMAVWPPVNSFVPPGSYPGPPFTYQPFSHASQYSSPPFFAPPYGYHSFGQPCSIKKEIKKETEENENSDSDSESSSSGAGQKSEEKDNSSDSKVE